MALWPQRRRKLGRFVAKFEGTIYVLHCFKKKTLKTSERDKATGRKLKHSSQSGLGQAEQHVPAKSAAQNTGIE